MNEEEKKAIAKIERQIVAGECERAIGIPVYISNLKTILNLIEKKDRQIDLMAEYISDQDIDEDICKKMIKGKQCNHFTYEPDCIECVKQYFKNKAEEDK